MISINVKGLAEAERALLDKEQRIRSATRKATSEGIRLAGRRAHAELSRYSHAPGTPTPSPAGAPPARVSGNLRGSLSPTGPVPTAGGFLGRLGPTAPYSRIHEYGGVTGRDHATVLPARPYMRPVHDGIVSDDSLRALYVRAWARAM